MKLDNVDVSAYPSFQSAICPKHHCDMIQLDNGWFSICWYCEKCGFPYFLKMMKMRAVNKENLAKVLERYYADHPKKSTDR
jgi:hypothetical protein